jgi:hypothetical protein
VHYRLSRDQPTKCTEIIYFFIYLYNGSYMFQQNNAIMANTIGITYILPQLDLALLAHIVMFFFIHILYCHNTIPHCCHILRCSFCIHILYRHGSCIYLLYDFIVSRLVSYHIDGSGSTRIYSRSLRMAFFCRNM